MERAVKLPSTFFMNSNVVTLAKSLLGKVLITKFKGQLTSGIITETEAYNGEVDRASHAFGGRRTERTEIMYAEGGIAYVYLCYGIHSLFNIVSNKKDVPHAILIRAFYPVEGIATMRKRRNNFKLSVSKLCIGPGTVSQALGIHYSDSGKMITGPEIWLEERNILIPEKAVLKGPRIGVDYAGKDALLPYRFRILHDVLVKSNEYLLNVNE